MHLSITSIVIKFYVNLQYQSPQRYQLSLSLTYHVFHQLSSIAIKSTTEQNVKIATAARIYGVNRQTICNRLKGKRSHAQFCEERRLLLEHEELAILNFIDQWVALGFSPQLSMIEERVQMLRNQ